MHFSLVVVGAHDGSRMDELVGRAALAGEVLLIEPVPFLFERLKAHYAGRPNVRFRNNAIAARDGEVEFYAPRETANSVVFFGDQLGSLKSHHAQAHHVDLSPHVDAIVAQALRYETLVEMEGISSLDLLLSDTEGMDADLIPTFPFVRVTPKRIIFEFKHTDGTNRVGRRLAGLLIFLEDRGYQINYLDGENFIAIHSS